MSIPIYGLIIFFLILLSMSLRILREYERGVIFQLGRFWKVKGPGLILLIPGIQNLVRVDLRTIVMDVPLSRCHLQRQRLRSGQCRHIFSGFGSGKGNYPGRKLRVGH